MVTRQRTKRFFDFNRWCLRILGLWPTESDNKLLQKLHYAYSKFILIAIVYFVFADWICIKDNLDSDMFTIYTIFTVALIETVIVIKDVYISFNKKRFEKLLEALESKEIRYEACKEQNYSPKDLVKQCKRNTKLVMNYLTISCCGTFITSFMPATIDIILMAVNYEKYHVPTKLPYFMWVPFKADTPFKYVMAVVYQAVETFYHAVGVVATDTLYINIINCITFNLVIIQGAFTTIRERCVKRLHGVPLLTPDGLSNSDALENEMLLELRKISIHLERIYWACGFLEKFYRIIVLLQIIAPMFILCTQMYLILKTPPGDDKLYTELLLMSVMIIQVSLYCWYGNEVTREAEKIPSAIWHCDWLGASTRFKKDLVFVMVRANRPLYLTAAQMVNLTLETLMKVFKASYSFMAVINS